MAEKRVKNENLEKTKLFIGVFLMVFMILIHVFVQELPLWLMGIPGFLMGFDPRDWVSFKDKK